MKLCTVEGCEKRHFGLGYCGMHYQRLKRFGSLDDPKPKPENWKPVKSHSHFARWEALKRRPNGVAKEWLNDLEKFANDVGPLQDGHALRPIRIYEPIGPENFSWQLMGRGTKKSSIKSIGCLYEGCNKKHKSCGYCEFHYDRWRSTGSPEPAKSKLGRDQEKFAIVKKRRRLKKYGLSIEQYDEMVKLQDGKCYICKNKVKLHVDHDHATNEVRKLLCGCCNALIGMCKESIEILNLAIEYLKEHD